MAITNQQRRDSIVRILARNIYDSPNKVKIKSEKDLHLLKPGTRYVIQKCLATFTDSNEIKTLYEIHFPELTE